MNIGNIILSYYKIGTAKDLDSLSNIINKKIKDNNKAKKILEQFLKYKKLFLETKYEKLKFHELEKKEERKKLFTIKFPSLINFLNYNYTIYNKLINEPTIFEFYPEENKEQFIPLWLLCLKFLANSGNIKVSFDILDEQTLKMEKELHKKITNSIEQCNNLDWLLLILPNNAHIIEEEFSERFYQFFKNLLIDISYFNEKTRKEMFVIIKNFIFKIFEQTFKNGMKYLILNDENLFNIEKELKEKFKNIINEDLKNFIKGNNLQQLNSLLKENMDEHNKNSLFYMKKKIEKNILAFEEADYKNRNIKLIQKKYQTMEENCNIYNNIYKLKDEINKDFSINLKLYDIDKYIKNKDAWFNNSNKHIIKYINEKVILINI